MTDDHDVVAGIDLDPWLRRVATVTPRTEPLPTEPLPALAELVRDPGFPAAMRRRLFAGRPALRTVLPPRPEPVLAHAATALAFAFDEIEAAGGDEERLLRVVEFAEHLGADHRKLAIDAADLAAFGHALAGTLAELAGTAWTDTLAEVLEVAYAELGSAMLRGMHSAPGPARVGATVVQVDRPTPDLARIRLVTDEMLDYAPGQYLSVQTPAASTEWRPLSPTIPANPARQIEFHLRAVPGGTTSGALVRGAAEGDRWVLAHPLGELRLPRDRDVLVVAGGTGVAPIRTLLIDAQRFPDHPRVDLYYGTRYPGELIALPYLLALAAGAPWLTVHPVVEHETDPWWMDAPALAPPYDSVRPRVGGLLETVLADGPWDDHAVLVSGSPGLVRATVPAFTASGVPREQIAFDPF